MTEPFDGPLTGEALAESIRTIRSTEPLVQELTNTVTINDVANCTLHWGALPVMADTPGDAGEMADLASAILLNPGQVPETKVEAMCEAGRRANERGVPVVLDPVGVGSTSTRQAVAERLLSELEIAAIKGNYGEISHLAGAEAEVRGVESVGEYEEIGETARALADATGAVVVASGVDDVVADSESAYRVRAGHELMGEVVGTGCLLGATVAVFCGALADDVTAALHATLAYGLAGERAAEEFDYDGPASYRIAFLDSIAGFTPDVAVESELNLEERLERLV
ncbi:hydroxyethylthiazole kinase [Natronoglomus mannanivorans]|uniref:Hydroxyethylthiazole kinase n=1 Tax=Natronoglomus mannanivorans TaxID=2979990 RepID=A0AAP2YXJ6_9EURY|nr:hydroxyethylthiazole kinase [Halobacteria archaeon AArc-xg1-1]